MKIVITGGTGLIGKAFCAALKGEHQIVVISRSARPASEGIRFVEGDPTEPGAWQSELETADAVLNLAGKPILCRWTKSSRIALRASRVDSTRLVAETLARFPTRADGSPKILLSGSAIGYYGFTGDEELSEATPAGEGFLPELSVEWERAALPAKEAGVRVVWTRIGVVLAREGGALPKLLTPFKLFVGGPVSGGKQWMSWIHIRDVVRLMEFCLTNDISGPINFTAPEPQKNWGFCRTLADVLHRPSWLRVPAFALRLLFGQAAIVVVKGQKVIPKAALAAGFRFEFNDLRPALDDLVGRR